MSTEGMRDDRFIASLERLAGRTEAGDFNLKQRDSAALARLRRGLDRKPGECTDMLPYVIPFLPGNSRMDHYFLTASLFAHHPPTDGRAGLSIGAAIHAVWQERDGIESIEKRFVVLLNAHVDELPHHLRQVIGLIKAQQSPAPLDYRMLLQHLAHWNNPDRWVQMLWARDFWGHKADPNADSRPIETDAQAPEAS
ncbi:MAG: type I-E CRISPR-associated protein Cse2/CasB [Chromatiaceae bacterium]|nr:type I-E CRISPR-associated protein Cse2/CasB [Chromatiaceae bacterium]